MVCPIWATNYSKNHLLHCFAVNQPRASQNEKPRKFEEERCRQRIHGDENKSACEWYIVFRSDYLTRFSTLINSILGTTHKYFCQSLDSVMINNFEQFYSQFLWLFSCVTRDCQQLSPFPLLAGYPVASVLITMLLRTESRGCRQSISAGVVTSLLTKMGVVVSIEVCSAIKLFVSPNVGCASIGVLTLGVKLLTSRSFVSAVLWRHFTDKVFCRPVINVLEKRCKIFSRFRRCSET